MVSRRNSISGDHLVASQVSFCQSSWTLTVNHLKSVSSKLHIQPYFNGSNTFGTMTLCSGQGQFKLLGVNHSAKSGGIIGKYFYFFFLNMEVCCVFALESPHCGDSNEYRQYTIVNIKEENHSQLLQIYECLQLWDFSLGLKKKVRKSSGK